ncbi:MAG TPA: PQQ-binding-like beta-propeller repeat protein [Polyangiales bacterium]|nr:PQQ-binding-like beta-propeller repeat protein [Polyangiales bacterium]
MSKRRALWGCGALLLTAAACSDAHTRNEQASERQRERPGSSRSAAKPSTPATEEMMQPTAAAPKPPTKSADPPSTAQPPDPPADKPEEQPEDTPAKPAPISEWRMMGYDVGSTYFNRTETRLTKANAGQLKIAWQANMDGNVYGAPLQVGSMIYASGPKDIRALEAETGKELWRVAQGSTSSLSFADGTLFLNTYEGKILALQASDGKMLWYRAHDSQPTDGLSSVIPSGDLLLVGGSNGGRELTGEPFSGYVAALDRKTGEQRWRALTAPSGSHGVSVWSTPSVDERAGRVFASTGNNFGAPASNTSDAILSFKLEDGAIVWINQRVKNDIWDIRVPSPDADFGANPVLYETMVAGKPTKLVAAGSKAGQVHAVGRDDGVLVWTRTLCEGGSDGSRGIYLNTSWSGKYVLVACNQGGPATLLALDGATGDMVWQRQLAESVWSRISIANGVGFLGSGPELVAFDTDTGEIIARYPSKKGTVAGTITVANGRVAFGEGLTWASGLAGNTLTVLTVP